MREEAGFESVVPPIVVVDVETTGLDPMLHGVIEIGAVALDADSVSPIGEFHTLVRAEFWHAWSAGAEAVHGVPRTVAESLDRPNEMMALGMFLEWVRTISGGRRATLAGMNPGFDLGMLRGMAKRTEQEEALRRRISHRTLDLHTLAWAYARELDVARDPADLHSDGICELLGLEPEPKPHRALAGARWEAEAFAMLL